MTLGGQASEGFGLSKKFYEAKGGHPPAGMSPQLMYMARPMYGYGKGGTCMKRYLDDHPK